MKETIKAIIKKPNDPVGWTETINNDLKTLQGIVGGLIEVVPLGNNMALIRNDEGKYKHLTPNIWVGQDIVCGTLIICGVDGEEFDDTPIQLNDWVKLIEEWGNRTR